MNVELGVTIDILFGILMGILWWQGIHGFVIGALIFECTISSILRRIQYRHE